MIEFLKETNSVRNRIEYIKYYSVISLLNFVLRFVQKEQLRCV